MLAQAVLYYGSESPPPERISLRAGSLSMVFEPQHAFLRYIRLGEHEVIRGIYAAVRDRNWGTIAPRVFNLASEVQSDSFHITFEVECNEGNIEFFWRGIIDGAAEGSVSFKMEGEARSSFMRNRIGFCVLHPIRECAGRPCVVEKTDGTSEHGVFPEHISPHQPFMDIRAIRHEITPGLSAEVRFAGDVFEMEDQRNWTDASYKTYCTPLSLAFPVEVQKGTAITQSVTILLTGQVPTSIPGTPKKPSDIVLAVREQPPVRLPQIGLGAASHRQPVSTKELARLKQLNLSHLRIDLSQSSPNWIADLAQAAGQAETLGCSLEVALFLGDDVEKLESLAARVKDIASPVARWIVFRQDGQPPDTERIGLARHFLSMGERRAAFGSGTNAFFAELNRSRPPVDALDFVCWSVNPQLHAFDSTSLAETLEAQVKSAR